MAYISVIHLLNGCLSFAASHSLSTLRHLNQIDEEATTTFAIQLQHNEIKRTTAVAAEIKLRTAEKSHQTKENEVETHLVCSPIVCGRQRGA